ncbi:MAG: peptide chain release factor 1 [Spirochaetaceae bacterium]|nr:MAG: peptide chain release factor 1 [Spirochaetaceae bacterium]
MFSRLEHIEQQYQDLERKISDPEIHKDPNRYKTLMQEHSHLSELIDCYRRYSSLQSELSGARAMVEAEADSELREMARDEVQRLEEQERSLERELKLLLVPKDPLDEKSSIMEIRAGTGGDEASLFAADLYRMYQRYAEQKGWKTELMAASETEVGGFKEVIFSINGKQVFGSLKYESGVHRVQRVPTTESSGRIHTSAVTVAVLPEAEDTDVQINAEELRVDVFRSSGPGGQSVNTTDSAVRVTHIPSGLVVTCQDEKSQHKNKAKALRVLKARLYEAEEQRKNAERANARKSQIGSGDRSERIRTYNFPQNRVTDHRINLTLYKLESVLQGELDETVEALKLSDREEKLQEQNG